jgi:hypothetical protein
MFPLHDTTRRRLCVAGFLVFGMLPTLLIGGWCISRHAPGCVQCEAESLSQQLGLNVKLSGLSYLRPGVVLYHRVEASDPETGRSVFRCRCLEIARERQTDAQGRKHSVIVVTASQPEIEAASLADVWRCLDHTLKGFHGPLMSDVQFSAAEINLHAKDHSQTLTEVHGAMENLEGGIDAMMFFRLAGADTPEPAHLRVVRNRQVSPPADGFELYTGDGALPCNVLAMGLDALKPLGPRCRFHGNIWANETPNGWQGKVAGQFTELELGDLVASNFPHKLTGVSQVTIESARFQRGRLEEGHVLLSAGPGRIDRSLFLAAVERLGLVPAANAIPDGETIPYEQLAFSATLDAQGLQLHGRCADAEPGAILIGRNHSQLLSESFDAPKPVVALVQTLVPQSMVQVPATRQTDWLLQRLPIPTVAPPPGIESTARTPVLLRNRDTQQR